MARRARNADSRTQDFSDFGPFWSLVFCFGGGNCSVTPVSVCEFFFSVVITKPWNPFHSSKYILVIIFLIVFCMEVLPEKITFASTQDEPHIGYFWRGGGVGREVVPSCPQISREIVCADLPISSIFRRPGTVGGYPHD